LAAVEGEVYIFRVFGELLELAAGIVVALLKGDEGVSRRTFESELAAECGPVDFEGGTPLMVLLAGYSAMVEDAIRTCRHPNGCCRWCKEEV
jgi:hypothetical protein